MGFPSSGPVFRLLSGQPKSLNPVGRNERRDNLNCGLTAGSVDLRLKFMKIGSAVSGMVKPR
jgi:hypothetical protein